MNTVLRCAYLTVALLTLGTWSSAAHSTAASGPMDETAPVTGVVNLSELDTPTPLEAITLADPEDTIAGQMPEFQQSGTSPAMNATVLPASDEGTQTASVPEPPLAVVIDTEAAGLDNEDNPVAGLGSTSPSYTQIAVGPSHVVELVNRVGRVYDKPTLAIVSTFKVADLFNVPTPRCAEGASTPCWFDGQPRVLFDALSGRWIGTYMSRIDKGPSELDLARLHIIVSDTDDPTGSWHSYDHVMSEEYPDNPDIGVSEDKITVTSNRFDIDTFDWVGQRTRVYAKDQMLQGQGTIVTVFPNRPQHFSVRPARQLDAENDQLAAMILGNDLTVFTYSGVPGQGGTTETTGTLTIAGHTDPPAGLLPGGGLIDTTDGRLHEAFTDDGHLWVTTTTRCVRPFGIVKSCGQVIEISPGSPSVLQDIVYGFSDIDFYYPSAMTDSRGNLITAFNRSSIDFPVSVWAAGRAPTDPPNSLGLSAILHVGEVDVSEGPLTLVPWGRYSSMARDPSGTGSCLWSAGQYAKDLPGVSGRNDWGTSIAKLVYTPYGDYGATCDDNDADGYTGVAESGTPLCGNGVNDDGVVSGGSDDGVVDDGCLGGPPQAGAYSEAEFNIWGEPGRDLDPCGLDAWPSDLVWGGDPLDSTNRINILDVTSFLAPKRLSTNPGDLNFDSRWDLYPGITPPFSTWIAVNDLTALTAGATAYPPMLGGEKAYGGPDCPFDP